MKKKKEKGSFVSFIATAAIFVAMLAVVLVSSNNLFGATNEEGVKATREAIERAAVQCYASEGFYPPGLTYIEEHYGVQIDHSRYNVRYEVFASNIMPTVRVMLL